MEDLTGKAIAESDNLLAPALEIGTKLGLDIVAWFEYGFAVHHKKLAQISPFAKLAVDTKLTIGWANDFLWLNPANSDVLFFITQIMLDCVEGYSGLGMAGIQLDDHFGALHHPGISHLSDWKSLLYCHLAYPHALPHSSEKLLNVAMKFVSDALVKAGVKRISLSPNYLSYARKFQRQNWAMWLNEKWVSEVIVQNYHDNIAAFKKNFNQIVGSVRKDKRQYVTKCLFFVHYTNRNSFVSQTSVVAQRYWLRSSPDFAKERESTMECHFGDDPSRGGRKLCEGLRSMA